MPIKFTKKDLKQLADAGSWERGVGYYEDGAVAALFENKGEIAAHLV